MSDRNAKQIVEQVLARLPDDATMEDIQYSLYVADLVRRRTRDVDAVTELDVDEAVRQGKLIPHEGVVKRMAPWLRK